MRFIGIMAVMIIGIATTRPEFAFLRGVDLTSAAVYFFAVVFVSLLRHYGCDDYWHSHYQARVCISERGGPDQRRGLLFCSGLCVVAAVEILSGVLEKQQ